jgi:hypothetical protein
MGRTHDPFAMQKVVGSSPIIRSLSTRWKAGFQCPQEGVAVARVPRASADLSSLADERSGAAPMATNSFGTTFVPNRKERSWACSS